MIDYICTTSRMKGPVDAENHLEILLCFCACPTRTNCQRQCSVCTFVEVPCSCTCIQNNNILKRSATTNFSYVALGILTCLLVQQGSPIAILKHKQRMSNQGSYILSGQDLAPKNCSEDMLLFLQPIIKAPTNIRP
jgi:hypothetical protein